MPAPYPFVASGTYHPMHEKIGGHRYSRRRGRDRCRRNGSRAVTVQRIGSASQHDQHAIEHDLDNNSRSDNECRDRDRSTNVSTARAVTRRPGNSDQHRDGAAADDSAARSENDSAHYHGATHDHAAPAATTRHCGPRTEMDAAGDTAAEPAHAARRDRAAPTAAPVRADRGLGQPPNADIRVRRVTGVRREPLKRYAALNAERER